VPEHISLKEKHLNTNKPCMPTHGLNLKQKSNCLIIGYGQTSEHETENIKILREARIELKKDSYCFNLDLETKFFDSNSMLCAGSVAGKNKANTCIGDSGGPLICKGENTQKWFYYGITSFGRDDCSFTRKAVYTKLSNYINWINKIIHEN
jgi:secreted trypsin-like serine protease